MWFNILKQPNLDIGMEGVGLINLDNVPEEEGRCKPKFLEMFNRLVDFFDTTAMDKTTSYSYIYAPLKGWNFKRKEKYIYPLKQVWLAYNDKLSDIKYCEMLEGAKRNNWGIDEPYGKYVYDYLLIDTDWEMHERPFNLRLRWAKNGDKDYIRQIKENIANILKQ